jgi:hypothetical protein
MKRRIAWLAAIVSGIYLLVSVPVPDPLPFIDEATALLVFVNAMAFLGYDARRWIPFLGKGRKPNAAPQKQPKDVTIDV